MPEGCQRARIRTSRRKADAGKRACLADTLGDEAAGMVVVDAGGHPMKYGMLTVFQDSASSCACARVPLHARVLAWHASIMRQNTIQRT